MDSGICKRRDSRQIVNPNQKIGPHIAAALLGEGVIGRAMPQSDFLGFAPPYCLTRDDADEIVGKTRNAIEFVLS